jgi:hypothetical protein
MLEGFLLGLIVASTLVAGLFFLKFWKQTHDPLFLAFAVAFLIEALNRSYVLLIEVPYEGSPWIYLVRLVAYLVILFGIIHKNRARPRA